jgi:hypothetical protein
LSRARRRIRDHMKPALILVRHGETEGQSSIR